MKKYVINNNAIFSLACLMILILATLPMKAQTANETVTVVKGKILDQETKKPIAFANVFLSNTGIGTVSNAEGAFILKVPATVSSKTVLISFMGYKSQSYPLDALKPENNVIELATQSFNIQEVIVRTNDPVKLIEGVLHSIPANYGSTAYICTAFYRESIMQNKQYVGVAEAVLNIYKSKYTNNFESDRVKVFKGRKSEDVKRMDTILFKLRGGQQVAMLLDLAKNPETFLTESYFSQYDYQPVALTNIEGRETYVVEFASRKDAPDALYQGKLFIDVNTLALKKVAFNISPSALELADKSLIIKKPAKTKVKTVEGLYSVDYRDNKGRWTLNHVHYDVKFKVDKKFHLFSKIYTSTVDLAITDKDTVNVTKFKYSEIVKPTDIFVDHVGNYYDENFWGTYNIIKPEEPIEDAVERISKKLNKNKGSL